MQINIYDIYTSVNAIIKRMTHVATPHIFETIIKLFHISDESLIAFLLAVTCSVFAMVYLGFVLFD